MTTSRISHLRLASSKDGQTFQIAEEPTFLPATPYEAHGVEDPRITLVDGWYYVNGLVENGYGTLTLYYGAGDETTCGATVSVAEILNSLTTTKGVCA